MEHLSRKAEYLAQQIYTHVPRLLLVLLDSLFYSYQTSIGLLIFNKFLTFSLDFSCNAVLVGSVRLSKMIFAINPVSSPVNPLAVIHEVPNLIPLAIYGLNTSPGTTCLFVKMPVSSSNPSDSLPVKPNTLYVLSTMRCVSLPPVTIKPGYLLNSSSKTFMFPTTLPI